MGSIFEMVLDFKLSDFEIRRVIIEIIILGVFRLKVLYKYN